MHWTTIRVGRVGEAFSHKQRQHRPSSSAALRKDSCAGRFDPTANDHTQPMTKEYADQRRAERLIGAELEDLQLLHIGRQENHQDVHRDRPQHGDAEAHQRLRP